MSESLYLSILGPVLETFLQQYPMIMLDLQMSDRLSNLPKREADVVIRITKAPPDSAVGRKLAASPMCVYASPEYLANRPRLDRWIAIDYPLSRQPAVPARTIASVNSVLAAAHLVRTAQGLAMLPCYQGDSDPGLTRLPGCEPVPDMHIWVLTHADLKPPPCSGAAQPPLLVFRRASATDRGRGTCRQEPATLKNQCVFSHLKPSQIITIGISGPHGPDCPHESCQAASGEHSRVLPAISRQKS